MHLKALGIALAASTAFATPALAQDRDTSGDFDGVYVGVSVGLSTRSGDGADRVVFDTARDSGTDNTVTTASGANAFSPGFCNGSSTLNSNATVGCVNDNDDLEYAARIGYDKRFGNIVAGVLIEGAMSDATDSTTAFSSTPAGYSFTRGVDYAVSARARLGITPGGGRGLMYVTGGGSYAKLDHTFTTTNTANSFTPNNNDDMVFGYQLGGGAEIKLGGNLKLGLEYLYHSYDDDKYFVQIGAGSAGATNPFVLAGGVAARPSDTSYNFHTFRATLGFEF
jgi:outer membrane immunogenic protein